MKTREIAIVKDLDGLPLQVWVNGFADEGNAGAEGVLIVGSTSARFDPDDDDSLSQLRELISGLQEIERVAANR